MTAAAPRRRTAARTPEAAHARRQRELVTPEGVAVRVTLAPMLSRFGAAALDLFLMYVGFVAVTLLLLFLALGSLGALERQAPAVLEPLAVLWIIILFLLRNAWFLGFELGARGATPGKRAFGIRVASRDGGRLTAEAVVARNMLREIELFLPLVFMAADGIEGTLGEAGQLAGWAWIASFLALPFINRDKLRAGDIVGGTWVIETPRGRLEGLVASIGAGDRASAATGARYRFSDADLAHYGEHELQVLESVLRQDNAAQQAEVAASICRRIGWEPGSGDERAFLEAYYAQLRARLERQMRFGRRKADKHQGG